MVLKELFKLNSNADYLNYLLDVIDSVQEEIKEDAKNISKQKKNYKKVNEFLSKFDVNVDC